MILFNNEKQNLITNINKVHTTKMGIERLKTNLNIDNNVVEYCKNIIIDEKSIVYKQGKNFYCKLNNVLITINSYSYTIITGHLNK